MEHKLANEEKKSRASRGTTQSRFSEFYPKEKIFKSGNISTEIWNLSFIAFQCRKHHIYGITGEFEISVKFLYS